jgi:hypothetical protein
MKLETINRYLSWFGLVLVVEVDSPWKENGKPTKLHLWLRSATR